MDSMLERPPRQFPTRGPQRHARGPRWNRAAAALLTPLLLVMSACGNLEMGVQIKSADDVAVTTDFSVKSSQTAGLVNKDDLCDALKPQGGSYPKLNTSPYERDGMIGCRLTTSTTLEQLSAGGMAVRNGNKVTIRFDTSSVSSPTGSTDSLDAMKLSVTFPGKVLSHTGNATVSGSTVTWTDPSDLTDGNGPSATGTLAEGLLGLAWWIWGAIIGAAALIGAAVVVAVVVRRRRSRRAAQQALAGAQQWGDAGYPPQDGYSYGQQPPPGYGQPGQYPPESYGAGQYGAGQYGAEQYGAEQYGAGTYPQQDVPADGTRGYPQQGAHPSQDPYPQDPQGPRYPQQSPPAGPSSASQGPPGGGAPSSSQPDPDSAWRPVRTEPADDPAAPGSSQPWGRPDAAAPQEGRQHAPGTGPDDVTQSLEWQNERTESLADRRPPWETPGWEDPGPEGRSPKQ